MGKIIQSLFRNEWAEKMNLMPEASKHSSTLGDSSGTLRQYYRDLDQPCFIAFNLMVYYPEEDSFPPDLLVVFEAEEEERTSWNVAIEGKGLDFVLEVVSPKSKKKDKEENLKFYARLGIPEYFYFDPKDLTLKGYTLDEKSQSYEKIPLQFDSEGKTLGIYSTELGLYLNVEKERLRFLDFEGNHL